MKLLAAVAVAWWGVAPPLLGQEAPGGKRFIIIDDDLGMLKSEVRRAGSYVMPWIPVTDPDGGLELIYALRDPRVELLGVTCTMGCSTTEVCLHSVQRILELAGRSDLPVRRGADSPAELGRETPAARFLVDTVRARPGEVEIVATAPLTNIATALMLEPELPRYWKALYIGTGEFLGALGEPSDAYLVRWFGYQDLNLNVDPAAARYVLEHGGDFYLYPNEIMDDARLTWSDRRRLAQSGSALGEWVAAELRPAFYTLGLINAVRGHPGLFLHGVIPLALALDPDLAEPPRELRVAIERRRLGGYIFTVTEDRGIPSRVVYLHLRDSETVTARMRERCF